MWGWGGGEGMYLKRDFDTQVILCFLASVKYEKCYSPVLATLSLLMDEDHYQVGNYPHNLLGSRSDNEGQLMVVVIDVVVAL